MDGLQSDCCHSDSTGHPVSTNVDISFNEDSPIVQNPGYVEESTYGSEDSFPESMKGCPAFDKLKACLGFWPQR